MLLKGIAIVLMVIGHSLGGGALGWYVEGISFPSILPYARMLGHFAAFAVVPLFLYLTGWTYYKHIDKSYKYSLRKISNFLLDYWLITVVYLFLAYKTCSYDLNITSLFNEMTTISNDVMIFSWFVLMYVEMMLFLPAFHKYMDAHEWNIKKAIICCIVILGVVKCIALVIKTLGFKETFIYNIFILFFRYGPHFLGGYIVSKYNLIERLTKKMLSISVLSRYGVLLGFVVAYNFVYKIATIDTGLILCPFYMAILASLKIDYRAYLSRIIMFLGKHSMNIWFLHCIFFAKATREYYQKYAFLTENPILDVMWILLMCCMISIVLSYIQDKISLVVNKIMD